MPLITLKNRIAAAVADLCKHGHHPRQVHLTSADAIQLQYELLAEGGTLGHAIMLGGIGKAMSSILGLEIVWKSQRFFVV